jgi:hypothetical protein
VREEGREGERPRQRQVPVPKDMLSLLKVSAGSEGGLSFRSSVTAAICSGPGSHPPSSKGAAASYAGTT